MAATTDWRRGRWAALGMGSLALVVAGSVVAAQLYAPPPGAPLRPPAAEDDGLGDDLTSAARTLMDAFMDRVTRDDVEDLEEHFRFSPMMGEDVGERMVSQLRRVRGVIGASPAGDRLGHEVVAVRRLGARHAEAIAFEHFEHYTYTYVVRVYDGGDGVEVIGVQMHDNVQNAYSLVLGGAQPTTPAEGAGEDQRPS